MPKPNVKHKPWSQRIEYFQWSNQTQKFHPSKARWLVLRRAHWLKRWMGAKGCAHCQIKDKEVLELDHLDTTTKSFAVFSKARSSPLQIKGRNAISELIREVRKCQVLCANCHKKKSIKDKDYASTRICNEERRIAFEQYHEE